MSSQHRTLYCYLLLWIMLIIIGMYKYVSTDLGINLLASKSFYANKILQSEHETKSQQLYQFQRQLCNDIEGLTPAEEGGLIEGWTLQGDSEIRSIQAARLMNF